jgi:hypothetical protein
MGWPAPLAERGSDGGRTKPRPAVYADRIGDVEAVANRLVVLNKGGVVADTPPTALLAKAAGQVWAITTDPTTALRLQNSHQVSAMVQQAQGDTLRIVDAARPHEQAVSIEPALEDAYLLAVGDQASLAWTSNAGPKESCPSAQHLRTTAERRNSPVTHIIVICG